MSYVKIKVLPYLARVKIEKTFHLSVPVKMALYKAMKAKIAVIFYHKFKFYSFIF